MNNLRVLHEEKSYRSLFYASIIQGVGDWISNVALLALLIRLTGTGYGVGITLAIKLIPYIIFGPLGGLLADKFPKKNLIIISYFFRSLLILSFLLVTSINDLWIAYTATFGIALCNALYRPAKMSMIPCIVNENNLLNVNILEQGQLGICLIIGGLLGGTISQLFGIEYTFIINAITYIIAMLIIFSIKEEKKQIDVKKDMVEQEINTLSFKQYLLQSVFLRVMIVLFLLWPIADGVVNFLVSIYAMNVFDKGDLGVGIYYCALGVGFVLSNLLTDKISKNILKACLVGLILEGVFNILLSQSPTFAIGAINLVGATLFAGIGIACNETIIMKNTQKKYQGRIFGMLSTIENSILGFSMLASAFLINFIGPRLMGLFSGLFFVIVALCFAPILLKMKKSGKFEI